MTLFQVLLAVAAGLVFLYLVLLLFLWRYAHTHPGTVGVGDALRLLPEVLGFLGRLVRNKTLSPSSRLLLLLILTYLASPIDLVPDFIPLIGYADDVVVVALVLRHVVRASGPEALARNWNGSATGLHLMAQLAGLPLDTQRPNPEDTKDTTA